MQRREKGTGTVTYRKATDRWVARYRPPGRKAIERTATTEREAKRLLAQLRVMPLPPLSLIGDKPPAAPLTLAAYLDEWQASARVRGASPNTLRTYKGVADRVNARVKGTLATVTPALVQAALDDMMEAGYSPRTVKVTRAILSTALRRAKRMRLIPDNPVEGTDPPRVPPSPGPRLTDAQVRAITEAFRETRIGGLVALASLYGMREAELCGLRRDAVSEGRIHVCGQVDERRQYIERTKSGRDRWLPLLPVSEAVLKAERVRQAEDRLRLGRAYRDGGYVFQTEDGRPYSPASVRRLWRKHRPAEVGALRFHDLRHLANDELRRLGVPDAIRESILGHTHEVNRAVYSHVTEAEQRAALRAWGERLLG